MRSSAKRRQLHAANRQSVCEPARAAPLGVDGNRSCAIKTEAAAEAILTDQIDKTLGPAPTVHAAETIKRKPFNTERDRILGEGVRALRKLQGDTQASFAAKLGVTFQQIQKYESGANKISAVRLLDLAHALRTSPEALLRCISDM